VRWALRLLDTAAHSTRGVSYGEDSNTLIRPLTPNRVRTGPQTSQSAQFTALTHCEVNRS